jgi:hypothetical protein
VEAVVGRASYRERISRHPLALGAETHPRRPRRWQTGMRSSTSRRGRACTSCGLSRLRFPRLLPGPCRPTSASPWPRDRVRERGGGAATGSAGRRAALPEPPFPLVGVPVTSADPVPIAGRSGRPTWMRKRSRGSKPSEVAVDAPGPITPPAPAGWRGEQELREAKAAASASNSGVGGGCGPLSGSPRRRHPPPPSTKQHRRGSQAHAHQRVSAGYALLGAGGSTSESPILVLVINDTKLLMSCVQCFELGISNTCDEGVCGKK